MLFGLCIVYINSHLMIYHIANIYIDLLTKTIYKMQTMNVQY